jgi:MarR family 2-MHQ and catechol resistance regulon transcriptional repressor
VSVGASTGQQDTTTHPRATAGLARTTDDQITLVGLVFEAAAGLRRNLSPGLDCELGVGGQSFDVLLRLARSPGQRLRMSDVAAQTGLSPGGLTRSIDRLVAAGLAVREACPQDRRASYARLTELGRARVEDALARHRSEVALLLEGLFTPEESKTLAALLRRLRDRVHPDAALVSGPEEPSR